jgi:integration host factor subunit beta
MTKGELIEHVARQSLHCPPQTVETILNAVLEGIATVLAQGERIELRGFGSFAIRERQARAGRNPRTGAAVAVAAKRVPLFKAAKELRQRVDGQATAQSGGGARPESSAAEQPRAALAAQTEADA